MVTPWTRQPAFTPSSGMSSVISSLDLAEGGTSSLDLEEEQIAVEFINKVRTEIHGLPGKVRVRMRLIPSIEG